MTVAELIDSLKEMPQDMECYIVTARWSIEDDMAQSAELAYSTIYDVEHRNSDHGVFINEGELKDWMGL